MRTKLYLLLMLVVTEANAQRQGQYLEPFAAGGSPFNYKIGCNYTKMFTQHLGFTTGLHFADFTMSLKRNDQTGASWQYGSIFYSPPQPDTNAISGVDCNIKYNFYDIGIPFLVRFITGKNDDAGFFMEGGVVAYFLAYSNATGSLTYSQYSFAPGQNNQTSATITINQRTHGNFFNAGLYLSVGAYLPINDRISLIFPEIEFNTFLTNVGKDFCDSVWLGTQWYSSSTSRYLNSAMRYNFYTGLANGKVTATDNHTKGNKYGAISAWLIQASLCIKLEGKHAREANENLHT